MTLRTMFQLIRAVPFGLCSNLSGLCPSKRVPTYSSCALRTVFQLIRAVPFETCSNLFGLCPSDCVPTYPGCALRTVFQLIRAVPFGLCSNLSGLCPSKHVESQVYINKASKYKDIRITKVISISFYLFLAFNIYNCCTTLPSSIYPLDHLIAIY